MIWLILSFLAATSASLCEAFSKKSLDFVDEYAAAFWLTLFALPLVLCLLVFSGIPQLGSQFWYVLIADCALCSLALILYMRAIKLSDISLSAPLLSFSPLFLLLTSPFLVAEFPTGMGLTGILLVVAGAYVLNISESRKGLLEPIRAILAAPGPKLMLCVALLWSFSSNLHKIGIHNSSTTFWLFSLYAMNCIVLFIVMRIKSKTGIRKALSNAKTLAPIGFFTAISDMFTLTAMTLTLVAYAISIKRLSSVITVLIGHFVFKEKGLKERLAGAAIMVLGVALIALS